MSGTDDHTAGCPEHVHLHCAHQPGMLVFSGDIVAAGSRVLALVPDLPGRDGVAQRICDLLNEHGFATVPDSLASSFPPPSGPRWLSEAPPGGGAE